MMSEMVNELRTHPSIKANWIDSVTELGEELTSKEIMDRINIHFKEEAKACGFNTGAFGGIISYHLNHKFLKNQKRADLPTIWKKIMQ